MITKNEIAAIFIMIIIINFLIILVPIISLIIGYFYGIEYFFKSLGIGYLILMVFAVIWDNL